MKSSPRQKRIFFSLLIAAVMFLLSGSILLLRNLTMYRSHIQESQDEMLLGIAQAVDSTIVTIYNDYCTELEYVTSRRGFLNAEEAWQIEGTEEELLFRMEENLVTQASAIKTMIAGENGKVLLSTDGSMDYFLPVEDDVTETVTVTICSDYHNRPYLAFVQKKEYLLYAVLMDLSAFYELVERNSGLLSIGELILADADSTVFLRREGDRIVTELLYDEGDLDDPLLQMLVCSDKEKEMQTRFYQKEEGDEEDQTSLRAAMYPASINSNQQFSIGILHDNRRELEVLNRSTVELLLFGCMIFLGIMLLLYCLYQIYHQEEKNLQEIRILKEKKDAMEALNQETLALAHHQRLETIGQLTSGIAHDFNNLLTPIMGYSLMVMENLPPEDTDSYDNLLEIYNASHKAKELISRLSDLSRKNSVLTMKYVNPNQLITNIIGMAETAKPNNVFLETSLDCQEVWLYGNETQFTQMLLNLLVNAFQVLEEAGGGTVQISCTAEGEEIIFCVKDNGPGIPEELQERIFDPFFTTKPIGKGTGLGLAIVQQVVEEHQGTIRLESEVGKGTCFTISFPIKVFED